MISTELSENIDDINQELDEIRNSKIDVTKIYQTSTQFIISKSLASATIQASCNSPNDIILNAGVGTTSDFVIVGSDPISTSSWEFSLANKLVSSSGDATLNAKASCLEVS